MGLQELWLSEFLEVIVRIGYIRDSSPAGRVLFEGPAETIRAIELFFAEEVKSKKQRTVTAVHLDELEDLRGEAIVLVPSWSNLYVFDYPSGFEPGAVDEIREELEGSFDDHRVLVFDHYWNPESVA